MRTRPRGAGKVAGALALGCAILAATAVLTETTPPRSRAPEAVVLSAATASGRLVATVTVTPATAGRNAISVAFADSSGVPVTLRAADAFVSNPTAGIEAIVRPLVRGADGVWRHEGPELAVVGEWTVRIEALVGDFERAAVSVRVPVR
jgi:copper transport protein